MYTFQGFKRLAVQFANLATALRGVRRGDDGAWIKEALEQGKGACEWMSADHLIIEHRERCRAVLHESGVTTAVLQHIAKKVDMFLSGEVTASKDFSPIVSRRLVRLAALTSRMNLNSA